MELLYNWMRGRDPLHFYDRVISKGNKGIQELATFLRKMAQELTQEVNNEEQSRALMVEVEAITSCFTARAREPLTNQSQRVYLVQGLQAIGFELRECEGFGRQFKAIATAILEKFSDSSEKVRFTAIGSLYNLLNVYSERGLEVFLPTFEAVAQLVTDDSGQVRQAAAFLNQSLKTMINEAVLNQLPFDLQAFIQSLAEKIQVGGSVFRQFLLDWLMTIEEVPHFELSFDLPLFFRQVFELLLSQNKSLRTKAEQCLKKFLHVFREILALGGGLCSKLREENAQMLVETVLLLIRQNLSTQITLQSLEWLEMFTKFFSLQVAAPGERFLQPVYLAYFRDIILVVISTLSDECDRIRRTANRINEALLEAFPAMRKDEKRLGQCGALLQRLLQENRLPVRVEAIFQWIILLLQHNSMQMLAEINPLIQHLVHRLCDRTATRSLFLLLEGSLLVQRYFHILVQTLLNYLSQNEQVPPEPIFRQLLSLSRAEENFLDLCRRGSQFQNSKFQYKLLEHLITILVTEHTLEPLRSRLEASDKEEVAVELFECFCRNEAALVILGFISQQYYLVVRLFKMMAHWQRLNEFKLKSLVRISNLIEHSNLNQFRTDLRRSGLAVSAYLSLLMAIPHGKYHNLLLQRLPPRMKPLPQEQPSQSERVFAERILLIYQNGWSEQGSNAEKQRELKKEGWKEWERQVIGE